MCSRSSPPSPLQCESSTDSTTSLEQLRERLTELSPVAFYKMPATIAAVPGLASVNELDEYDNFSNRDHNNEEEKESTETNPTNERKPSLKKRKLSRNDAYLDLRSRKVPRQSRFRSRSVLVLKLHRLSSDEINRWLKVGDKSRKDPTSTRIASVESWITRNAAAESTTGTGDKVQDLYILLMQTLETRLDTMSEATAEAMQAHMQADQEELSRLEEYADNMARSAAILKAKIEGLRKSTMECACELMRVDADNKTEMILQLKEDIKRILK